MEVYLQTCAGVLLALILILTLGSKAKQTGSLLAILVCCMVGIIGFSFLKPVVEFLRQLQEISGANHAVISTMLKITGIGLLSEISALICTDAGNGSLGKVLQMLASSVILWLSLPMFSILIELLQKILGEL